MEAFVEGWGNIDLIRIDRIPVAHVWTLFFMQSSRKMSSLNFNGQIEERKISQKYILYLKYTDSYISQVEQI